MIQARKKYLDYLTDTSFHGINILFVLLLEKNADKASYERYYPPKEEIKDCSVIIDGKNFD